MFVCHGLSSPGRLLWHSVQHHLRLQSSYPLA
jgi:hypothetical protein